KRRPAGGLDAPFPARALRSVLRGPPPRLGRSLAGLLAAAPDATTEPTAEAGHRAEGGGAGLWAAGLPPGLHSRDKPGMALDEPTPSPLRPSGIRAPHGATVFETS